MMAAQGLLRMRQFITGCCIAAVGLLAACETAPPSRQAPSVPGPDPWASAPAPQIDERARKSYDPSNFLTPPHMRNRRPVRVALLLPFSSSSKGARDASAALFDAAQLAVFDAGDADLLLLPKDTAGTADGAAAAAEAALADGAELIIGPLFSQSVGAVAERARPAGVPVIAFSSDLAAAGGGVFLLSYPPEVEVARIVDYAMVEGRSRIAALTPNTDYGRRVGDALAEELYARAGEFVQEETYALSPQAMQAPAKRLARYDQRRSAIQREQALLKKARQGDEDAKEAVYELRESAEYMLGYDAVLLPEQGNLLRALAPLLPYYDVNTRNVKLLGTSLWDNPALAREPALAGGWFAAPDPQMRQAFSERYQAVYGTQPARLAPLAYDAATLAARLSRRPARNRFSLDEIADPNGYLGVDGIFRFLPNGMIERGLAVKEVQRSGFRVISPAPKSFTQVGF